jgi:hypothetical protein
VLPFILSCIVVILITVVAERYGTKVGGILGTVPSTIVVAFLFIAVNEGVTFATRAAVVVPAEMGVNLLFLFSFSLLARRSVAMALAVSLSLWALLSGILALIRVSNLGISVAFYLLVMFATFMLLERHHHITSSGKTAVRYTTWKLLFRGVFAGIVIATAVVLAQIDETLSGIFSVFPAIFLSTMLIFVREHGPVFTGGMGKSMILGTLSVSSYPVSIHFLYPSVGVAAGTVVGIFVALCITFVLMLVRERMR